MVEHLGKNGTILIPASNCFETVIRTWVASTLCLTRSAIQPVGH